MNEMILTSLSPNEIFYLTVIGEARGEPIEGQVAVANVINNRFHADSIKYPNYSFVCLEREQFSCWNVNDSNRPYLLELGEKMLNAQDISDPYLEQCIYVVDGVLEGKILDNTKNAIYYMTTKLFDEKRPDWARFPKDDPKIIGHQTFFNV